MTPKHGRIDLQPQAKARTAGKASFPSRPSAEAGRADLASGRTYTNEAIKRWVREEATRVAKRRS